MLPAVGPLIQQTHSIRRPRPLGMDPMLLAAEAHQTHSILHLRQMVNDLAGRLDRAGISESILETSIATERRRTVEALSQLAALIECVDHHNVSEKLEAYAAAVRLCVRERYLNDDYLEGL